MFLAETSGHSIGYLTGSLLSITSIRPIRVVVLESMFVLETYRGQRIGTRLLQSFREWAMALPADRLQGTTYASNVRAIAFYRRQGFEPWKLTLGMENTQGV